MSCLHMRTYPVKQQQQLGCAPGSCRCCHVGTDGTEEAGLESGLSTRLRLRKGAASECNLREKSSVEVQE